MAESKITFCKIEELLRLKRNDELKLIIQQANPLDLIDKYGTTILHLAAKHNNADLIKFLLLRGYDANVKNVCGITPLLMAASFNSPVALNVLLDANVDILIPVVKGKSTLELIIEKQRTLPTNIITDLLKHLRQQLIDANKIVDILTKTKCPLDYVLPMKDAEITEKMLSRQEWLVPTDYRRLIDYAMKAGYLENVRLLLQHARGDYVSTIAYITNLCNMIDAPNADLESAKVFVVKMDDWNLYEHFWLVSCLCRVFEAKSKDIVRLFLDCGVDRHVRTKYGFDLIVHLFENKNFEASELLEHREFNANALNVHRASGLCGAATAGLKKNIQFLLSRNADPNLTDGCGLTPVHYVRLANCVVPLLKHGADIQIIGNEGQTVFDKSHDSSTVQLAHLAMIEVQGVCVKQAIRDRINADDEMKYLFKKCSLQLDWMRNMQIFKDVTLFTALVEKIEKFAHCIRSHECANMILNRCKVCGVHDYYYFILKHKLKKAAKMYDLRCKAAKIISDFMGIDSPAHVIIEMIIDYLNLDDLEVFAGDAWSYEYR